MDRKRIHEIIFEAETPAGKRFDVILLCLILLSVTVVMLESVVSIDAKYGELFDTLEWVFTILFSIEYLARIYVVKKPLKYMTSFFGLVDLFSILPTFLEVFLVGTGSLQVIRILRLLRVFRVLKLIGFLKEADVLRVALASSKQKIVVFLIAIMSIVVVLGTVMYIIEDPSAGFTSIPRSIYWAIVTLTTVGYGDIAPQSAIGQFLASIVMILGYAIIAVPTGIMTAEIGKAMRESNTRTCPSCHTEGHSEDAVYCRKCGAHLDDH